VIGSITQYHLSSHQASFIFLNQHSHFTVDKIYAIWFGLVIQYFIALSLMKPSFTDRFSIFIIGISVFSTSLSVCVVCDGLFFVFNHNSILAELASSVSELFIISFALFISIFQFFS
jgi:hypothetical protein